MTHVPTYQNELPIITDNLDILLTSCPSLLQCRISFIVHREVLGCSFFVGRLSDARFLYLENFCDDLCAIVIAPKCDVPMNAPFRRENHDGDIACSMSSIHNQDHKKLMSNGCLVYTLKQKLISISQMLQSVPFK